MDEAFSSLIGHVDASIDHRSQLVSALRSTFGYQEPVPLNFETPLPAATPTEIVPVPATQAGPAVQEFTSLPPAAPSTATAGESFTDVIAQLDRGLDERQKLINALKGQLSKVAALPKTAPPPPAPLSAAPAHYPQQLSAPSAAAAFTPAPVLIDDWDVPPVQTSPPGPLMPPPSIQGGTGQSLAAPPPAKRARLDGDNATGLAAPSAEAAELAAMKAKMLGNLQAAESIAQAKAPTMALPVGEEEPTTGTMPTSGATSPPGGAGDASSGPPQASACPPGTSQEEFEAYRQKCWKEYYEKCAVWQKYYDRNQAEKGKGKGKIMPMMPRAPAGLAPGIGGKGSGLPMPFGKPGPQVVRPQMGVVVDPALAGKGRPPAGMQHIQGARQRAEEDIHSKLLGL